MHAAVAELYRVFQPYRLGDDFTGCSHCVSPQESRQLAARPLRELTVADLDRYARKALSTWGEERHFKHFLPRLLELALDDYESFTSPEALLAKLAYAHWTTWPEVERQAIDEYLRAFFLHHLNLPGSFPHDDRLHSVLGGLAETGKSLLPYLDWWGQSTSPIAALHLAQLVMDTAKGIMTRRRVYLWGEPVQQSNDLLLWLGSAAPRQLLELHRQAVDECFPLAFAQLDGVQAAL